MKLLVVEDDPEMVLEYTTLLEGFGYEVTAYTTGEAALQACRREFYPLIILDVLLPGMDGLDLCRHIRALSQGSDSIILVMTAAIKPEYLHIVLDAGADDYLMKPINPQLLKIRLAIAERHMQDRLQRREMEAALWRAKETAETGNRAMSQFLANMSHELRTPLNSILGYAQILGRDEGLTGRQHEAIRTIYQSGEHLLLMINDILDISKIQAGKLELLPVEFHFPTFLRVIGAIIQVRAEQKRLKFSYHSAGALPEGIYADEKRLRQILLNLLGNAVKFTEKGEVRLVVESVEKHVQPVSAQPSGQTASGEAKARYPATHRVRFKVEDTGVGISPEYLDSIFLAFHQIGRSQIRREGAGLGLAISQQLAHLMGTQLQVESQPGLGSTFWFELELAEINEAARETAPDRPAIIGYTSSKDEPLMLLVVDDQADNRAVLRNALEQLNFEIIEAVHGQDGVAKAARFRPDLILMDLAMPVLDGYEAVRQIRQTPDLAGVPIIALSADVLGNAPQKSLAAGCNDFLTKPILIDELLLKLEKFLDLSWIYGERTPPVAEASVQLQPPARAQLERFYELVQMGDIVNLQTEARRLIREMADKPEIAGFGAMIVQMAEKFQLKAIKEFIEQYRQ